MPPELQFALAVFAVAGTLIGVWLGAWQARRAAKDQWERERADRELRERREAYARLLAAIGTYMNGAIDRMGWFMLSFASRPSRAADLPDLSTVHNALEYLRIVDALRAASLIDAAWRAALKVEQEMIRSLQDANYRPGEEWDAARTEMNLARSALLKAAQEDWA
jgi:hypothetical protein